MDEDAEIEKINSMSHFDMCWLYRHADVGHPYFVSDTALCQVFSDRFKKLGGMTPEMSKLVGWK